MSQFRTLVFENEYVRVLRFDVAPGETVPMHAGDKRLIYSLDDYTITWREAGQAETVKSWKMGDVHVHEALEHGLTNTGDTPARFLVFERLDTALPQSVAAQAPDIVEADTGHAGLLFENEDFRVAHVGLAPGEAQPLHEGGWRAVYSLTDYTISWQEGDQPVVSKQWAAGQAHWHEPGPHKAVNSGDTPAEWLVVTFR